MAEYKGHDWSELMDVFSSMGLDCPKYDEDVDDTMLANGVNITLFREFLEQEAFGDKASVIAREISSYCKAMLQYSESDYFAPLWRGIVAIAEEDGGEMSTIQAFGALLHLAWT